jgi:hypothetical protein
LRLALWAPGTRTVEGLRVDTTARVAVGRRVGRQSRLAYTARTGGVYYLELKLITRPREPLQYALALSRRSP